MTGEELVDLMQSSNRRAHVIGTLQNGVIAGLDLEGRLFTVINNKVINRVVPEAIQKRSNKNEYQNPGGDALWPAPEGTTLGYQYATGKWRVPPSVTGAVWEVTKSNDFSATIRAEVDLINNQLQGIPCEFEREINLEAKTNCIIQKIKETIRYVGGKILQPGTFSLAPWSLCQFDVQAGNYVSMPVPGDGDVWDMYDNSESQRSFRDDRYIVKMETTERFQLGISNKIEWIEYVHDNVLRVKRYTRPLPGGLTYIDISDSPPTRPPGNSGVSLSVYCDPSGFMEIEACGGCTEVLEPRAELSVEVVTEYQVS